MTYAKIVAGVVTEIKEEVTLIKVFTRLRYKLSFHKRIDLLEIPPLVGWHYNSETDEFSE